MIGIGNSTIQIDISEGSKSSTHYLSDALRQELVCKRAFAFELESVCISLR